MLSLTAAKPPVFVAESQFDLLFNLAEAGATPAARLLRDELERSQLIDDDACATLFARLGDSVRFRDLQSGRERSVILVTPDQADPERSRLSVLSLAGAALIGLEPGASFCWTGPIRRQHGIQVLEVAPS